MSCADCGATGDLVKRTLSERVRPASVAEKATWRGEKAIGVCVSDIATGRRVEPSTKVILSWMSLALAAREGSRRKERVVPASGTKLRVGGNGCNGGGGERRRRSSVSWPERRVATDPSIATSVASRPTNHSPSSKIDATTSLAGTATLCSVNSRMRLSKRGQRARRDAAWERSRTSRPV